jgi:hypothetical protein
MMFTSQERRLGVSINRIRRQSFGGAVIIQQSKAVDKVDLSLAQGFPGIEG